MKREEITNIIQNYVQKIRKKGIPVIQVYVFGSTVKGATRPGSDIDTCIISPVFGRNRQKERLLLMNLREGVSDLIEPHPYSEEDFQNPFDPLSSQIREEGVRII